MKTCVMVIVGSLIGCTGAEGPPGADGTGKNTLVRVDDEASGANCALGGRAIRTGVDTNADGMLQDTEVTGTTYVCHDAPGVGGVLEGDWIVHNSYDLTLIAGVTKITGDLTIVNDNISTVVLPNLHEVVGHLTIMTASTTATAFSALDFTGLTKVGGLTIDGTHVTSLAGFAALTQIANGGIELEGNAALAGPIDFSHVTGALDSVTLFSNPLITTFDVTGADTSGVALLDVEDNPALTSLTGFHAMTGDPAASVTFLLDTALTSVDLHSLAAVDSITIRLDTSLTTIDLGSLNWVTTLFKITGTQIKQCTLDPIVAQLTHLPTMPVVAAGTAGTCP